MAGCVLSLPEGVKLYLIALFSILKSKEFINNKLKWQFAKALKPLRVFFIAKDVILLTVDYSHEF